jgi:copper transport protein
METPWCSATSPPRFDAEDVARTASFSAKSATRTAMLLIIPASLLQAAWEGANAAKHPLFTEGFNPSAFATYLTSPGAGTIWSIRLVLIALATISFVAAVLPLRGRLRTMRNRVGGGLLTASLAMYSSELLVRTAPPDLTVDTGRTITNWLLDWSHLIGAAVWVGGLMGLAVTASLLRPSRGAPSRAARSVIRGFSNLAILCVGVLTVSGTWEAWLHIGSPQMLLTTLYGRTLLLKLGVVAVLLTLGAINLLHVLPRLEAAQRVDPDRPSLIVAALRHFRKVVILEAVLGIVVLAIVPFLSGSARSQDAALRSANLTQTAVVGSTTVALTPSALQAGLVDYDVVLPASFNDRVSLVFDSPELGVPVNEVVATARGNGTYRASGLLTPMVGEWRVQVVLGDNAAHQSASFALPVKAQPVAPPANQTPAVDANTVALGFLEILAVVGALSMASKLSAALSSMPLARARRRV